MKALLLLGAVSSSMVGAIVPSSTYAQNNPSITSNSVALTCRAALEGGPINEVSGIAAPPCCYVTQEEPWYTDHGIMLSATYQRYDGEVFLTEPCDLVSMDGVPVDQATTGSIGNRNGVAGGGTAASPTLNAGGSAGNSGGGGAGGAVPDLNNDGGPATGNTGGNGDAGNSGNSGDVGENGGDDSMHGEGPGNRPTAGNPGNTMPRGGAGEAPNGDVEGFKPSPGTKGKSN